MPRFLTSAFRQAAFAAHTAEAPILLVTISHPSLLVPIRLSTDYTHTISRGELYVRLPMELTLPDDIEDRPPRARITMSNISREIVHIVRAFPPGEAPSVMLELVLASDMNNVEEAWGPFLLSEPTFDVNNVSAELAIDDRSQEPFGEGRYTADQFPALFAGV